MVPVTRERETRAVAVVLEGGVRRGFVENCRAVRVRGRRAERYIWKEMG